MSAILPEFGISPERRVPALYIGARGLFPHEYLRIAWQMRSWNLKKDGIDTYTVRHGRDTLLLTPRQAGSIICEWKDWQRYYLPNFALKGKTVLDIGAGCGETAYFYFLHGAEKVIAIEIDENQLSLLRKNAKSNHWNIKVIPRAFELEDLKREKFDFAKIDIEGERQIFLSFKR